MRRRLTRCSSSCGPARRGFAIGVFGVGVGGTAISNFTTVRLADAYGPKAPFFLVAAILVAYAAVAASGAVFALVGKVAPADKVGTVTGVVGAAGELGGFIPRSSWAGSTASSSLTPSA